MSFIEAFIAQVSDVSMTPVGILIACNAALTVGVSALYRDCKRDRSALWAHIKELEKRLFPSE